MQMLRWTSILLGVVLVTPALAQEKDEEPATSQLRVFRLEPLAAKRINQVLVTMFPIGEIGGPKIVLEENKVVVRAKPEVMNNIAQVIDTLNRPRQMVETEIVLVARVDEDVDDVEQFSRELSRVSKPIQIELNRLRGGGSWKVVEWMQLTTLDQQPAFTQIGKTRRLEPKGLAEPLEPNDERANVYAVLGMTPRIESDQSVTIELDLDRSAQGEILDRDPPLPREPTPVAFIRIQTTIEILPNRAVVLGGMRQVEGHQARDWRLIVAAKVIDDREVP